MSIRQGSKIIAGKSTYRPSLFEFKWSDHAITDLSWLPAHTFAWHTGVEYSLAFNHLKNDLQLTTSTQHMYAWVSATDPDNIAYTHSGTPLANDAIYDNTNTQVTTVESVTSTTEIVATVWGSNPDVSLTRDSSKDFTATIVNIGASSYTETIENITITYYLANDGHKICLPDQESNIEDVYTATGVAWYYIFDYNNTRFKLPRTQWGVVGFRDTIGKYVKPGVPNITSTFDGLFFVSSWQGTNVPMSSNNGVLYNAGNSVGSMHVRTAEGSNQTARKLGFDASKANAAYGASSTVQQPATQTYLYFYVGQFNELELDNPLDLLHKNREEIVTGTKIFKGNNGIRFESADNTNYRGFMYKQTGGQLALGIQKQDNSSWQNYIQFNPNNTINIRSDSGINVVNSPIISNIHSATLPNNSFVVSFPQDVDRYADLIGAFNTTNNKRVATIRSQNTPTAHSLILGAHDFNNNAPTGITIKYDNNNTLSIQRATTPPNSTGTGSLEIPTIGWVNTNNQSASVNNLVHLNGEETITGKKTLTNNLVMQKSFPALALRNTDVELPNANTNSAKYASINYQDKNGKELGYVRHAYYTSNNVNYSNLELIAIDPDTSHVNLRIISNNNLTYNHSTTDYTNNYMRWVKDNVYYYTSGTSNPAVNANIYSDTACSIVVDTVAEVSGTRLNTTLTLLAKGGTARGAYLNFNPTASSSKTDAHLATIGWVNNGDLSTNIVHRDNDENITGCKTIKRAAPHLKFQDTNLDVSTTPSANVYANQIQMLDKNGRESGYLYNFASTDGTNRTIIQANKRVSNSNKSASIQVCLDSSGTGFMITPGYSKSMLTYINEGTTHNTYTKWKNINATKGTAPSQDEYHQLIFTDSADNALGYIEHVYTTDKKSYMRLITKKCANANDTEGAILGVVYNADGTTYTECPTVSMSSYTNNIATTKWVKDYAMGKPNWSSIQSISTGYTATSDGYIFGAVWTDASHRQIVCYINGNGILVNQDNHYGGMGQMNIPVKKGDVWTAGGTGDAVAYFVPCSYA